MRQIQPLSSYTTAMKVVVISKDDLFIERASVAVKHALGELDIMAETESFTNFLELFNSNYKETIFLISEESVLNDLEDLIYLKTCRNKFSTAVIMHAYSSFQPAIMEDGVINAVNKFVNKDSNLEVSINRSIKNLKNLLIEVTENS
ncbi:MAG: hypothetical protein ABJG68_17580 [Crocinitomicaceae bacterium]